VKLSLSLQQTFVQRGGQRRVGLLASAIERFVTSPHVAAYSIRVTHASPRTGLEDEYDWKEPAEAGHRALKFEPVTALRKFLSPVRISKNQDGLFEFLFVKQGAGSSRGSGTNLQARRIP
jgi:hypothetical protein